MDRSIIFALTIAFLVGSVPCGYFIGKLKGVNVLRSGSGSTGATNVRRTVGRWPAYLVFLLDALKGSLSALLPGLIAATGSADLSLFALILAMVGHSFSPFLKLRGGKGVAVAIGGLALVMPNVLAIGLLFWVILFSITRLVSLASIGFAAILPLASYLFYYSANTNCMVILLAGFIILRHFSNIRRLIRGTELGFGKGR